MSLRPNPHQNPLHCRQLPFTVNLFKVIHELLPQEVAPVRTQQILPVRLLLVLFVLHISPTARLYDSSALVLQEEPLCGIIEHLIVHVVHLLALDQLHDVQIVRKLLFTPQEELVSPLCLLESFWAIQSTNALLCEATINAVKHSVFNT